MKSRPMLTKMILRWVLTQPCQSFPMMRFFPWLTTSGCSVSRFLELICDLEKKVTVLTWSCPSELFFTNLKETSYWKILLLRVVLTFSEVPDTKNADTDSTGIDDMNEASEIKCKKKLLGLLASWVRLTTCSSLVKVRILLRKLVNSKVWNRILSNNILWFKELKACIKLSDIGHCLDE